MRSIFTYTNYRIYLRDALREKQKKNSALSLRSAAQRIGITSGSLTRILNGSRHAGTSLCSKLIPYLGLKKNEAEYFSLLVKFESARNDPERRACYQRISRMRSERNRTIPHAHYQLFEQWYHIALLELLKTFTTCPSYRRLGRMLTPPVSEARVRKAVVMLENLGYLQHRNDGTIEVKQPFLTTGDTWESTAIHDFQVRMAAQGVDALDSQPKKQRDFSTLTMALSNDALDKIRAILTQTRADIAMVEQSCEKPDRVYQINFQCFPLTTPPTGGKKQ